MAVNPHVPKFGNWDTDGDVPYTICFENARELIKASGKTFDPNDPDDYPEDFMAAIVATTRVATESENRNPPLISLNSVRSASAAESVRGRDQSDDDDQLDQKKPNNPRNRKDRNRIAGRISSGSECMSMSTSKSERRSLDPHRVLVLEEPKRSNEGGKSGGGKKRVVNIDGNGSFVLPTITGRQRHGRNSSSIAYSSQRSNKVVSIPKFGSWDEHERKSRKSGDEENGYTAIFNKVKMEKRFAQVHANKAHQPPAKTPVPNQNQTNRNSNYQGSSSSSFVSKN